MLTLLTPAGMEARGLLEPLPAEPPQPPPVPSPPMPVLCPEFAIDQLTRALTPPPADALVLQPVHRPPPRELGAWATPGIIHLEPGPGPDPADPAAVDPAVRATQALYQQELWMLEGVRWDPSLPATPITLTARSSLGDTMTASAQNYVRGEDNTLTLRNAYVTNIHQTARRHPWDTVMQSTTITTNTQPIFDLRASTTAATTLTVRLPQAQAMTDLMEGITTGVIHFDYSGWTNELMGRNLVPMTPAQVAMQQRRQARRSVVRNHRGEALRSEAKGRAFARVSKEEVLALQLLRGLVDQTEFRRYLQHRFVNVRGPSGLVYQIPASGNAVVWDKGTRVASLCVHLQERCPLTDEVVAKYLMATMDEANLWKRSNVTWLGSAEAKTRVTDVLYETAA